MTTEDPTYSFNPLFHPERTDAADPASFEPTEKARCALLRELKRSGERWRSLVETTQDWVWEVDAMGCYTYASPQVQALLGYTPDEVVGKTPFDFMPPEERQRVFEAFTRAVVRRAPFQGLENINQRKDGSLVVLETNGVPFFDENGDFAGYRGIDRDITERRRSETAMRRNSEELEAIFSNTHILIAVLDREFNFLRVNKSYAEKLNRDTKSLVGYNLFELYPHEESERLFRQVVQSGEAISITATPYELTSKPDLGPIYWDWTLTPIKGESGGVEGLIITLVDSTERERQRRAAEVTYWQAQAQLEQRVRERTAALEVANRELEAFSYAVSHDLRAPLRAINGFSSVLREDCADALDDVGRAYLERIQSATLRMGELIDGLLSLSLIFRTELKRQRVDLSALAHDYINHLREEEPARKVVVHIEPDLMAFGDASLLRLLLQNLLGNAWKFTAHHSESHIHFGRETPQGSQVYVVRDNGVGFDMSQVAKMFQPFERLHGRDQFDGNGIGLATVRRIVERHGGTVWAEGRPQQGAAFYFTLGTPEAERE